MPPYSGAAALRGRSFAEGLVNNDDFAQHYNLQFYTTTPSATIIPGVSIITLPVAETENVESLKWRVVGELKIGWVAGRHMFAASKAKCALISSPAYLSAFVISMLARIKRVPYMLELRDIYPEVYAEAGLLRRSSIIYRILLKATQSMYRNAEAIIAATDGLKQIVENEAGDTQVYRVYNGFPNALLQLKQTKHERFTVCFHGILGFLQDIETLRIVAERLEPEDIDVIVIGYGRKANILSSQPLKNLRFLGRLPYEQTINEVARCHIGLCLRIDDGISKIAFPVKVWEYLGLRMPSIITPYCEAGEFLENEKCGFHLPAGDVDGIVRLILELKKSPLNLEGMISRAEQVAPNFTREILGKVAAGLIIRAFGLSDDKQLSE